MSLRLCSVEEVGGLTKATYKFKTRKIETSVGNFGVDTKRLIGLVWVRMFDAYKAYAPIPHPKPIVMRLSKGEKDWENVDKGFDLLEIHSLLFEGQDLDLLNSTGKSGVIVFWRHARDC